MYNPTLYVMLVLRKTQNTKQRALKEK